MDEADLAQIREETILSAALSSRPQRPTSPDGICIWCEDAGVVSGTAFCSSDCGEDYVKYQRELKHRVTV